MKTLIAVLLFTLSASAVFADTYVRGHYRKDGTYVQPHYRSDPNSQRWDNYPSEGNTNPYTGQKGYKSHEFSNPPAYNNPRRLKPGW